MAKSPSYVSGGLSPSSPTWFHSSGFHVHSHELKWIGRPRRTWSTCVVKPGKGRLDEVAQVARVVAFEREQEPGPVALHEDVVRVVQVPRRVLRGDEARVLDRLLVERDVGERGVAAGLGLPGGETDLERRDGVAAGAVVEGDAGVADGLRGRRVGGWCVAGRGRGGRGRARRVARSWSSPLHRQPGRPRCLRRGRP